MLKLVGRFRIVGVNAGKTDHFFARSAHVVSHVFIGYDHAAIRGVERKDDDGVHVGDGLPVHLRRRVNGVVFPRCIEIGLELIAKM